MSPFLSASSADAAYTRMRLGKRSRRTRVPVESHPSPIVQPLVIGGQVVPHLRGQTLVARGLGGFKFPALFHGGRGVLHLINGDETGDGGAQDVAAEHVAKGHTGALVVLGLAVGIRRATRSKQVAAGERFDADQAHIVLAQGLEHASHGLLLAARAVGRHDHFDLRILGHGLGDPGAMVCRDAGESRFARLLPPFERRHHVFDFPLGVFRGLLHHGEPPQVDVLQSGLLQAVVHALLELVERPGDGRAARQRPIEAHVNFLAPALHGFGIDRHLRLAACIDVVDTAVEAGIDDVSPVLLEILAAGLERDALPVPADADHGDHEAGAAQAAIIHVFIVTARLARVGRRRDMRFRPQRRARQHHRAGLDEFAP
ncbi:hypothetical protein SBA2_810032 [Acidobacteriia bacterium SbA2]|nr:hypothetical protein SBA2_810032 [Acidobacteriia bacterium SbA2]